MILHDWIFSGNTATYWLIYCLLCIPVVYLLLWCLPRRLERTWILNFIFIYLLASSVFIFGILIAAILVLALYWLPPRIKTKSLIELAEYPEYQRSPRMEYHTYGEGFGYKVIKDPNLPKETRQQMLFALNQFSSPLVNDINTQALTDDVDEMRLYAQSLIEKQERRISKILKSFTLAVQNAKDKKVAAFYKKQIAQAWWEQIYRYIIKQEHSASVLDKIEHYAKEALEELPQDIELPLLLARVALKKGDTKLAREWLRKAEVNQAPAYKIVSYLAEIEFNEKNYTAIKHLLSQGNYRGILGLQPIISFWVNHD